MPTSGSKEMGLFGPNCGKYFAVGILSFINLLNYMDRYTLAGILTDLEDPTRNGFHNENVDDALGGLLQTAFIVSYMLLSPVFGYLGDRYTRKYIIAVGILLWSSFTLLGSFSVDYWMLLGTRMLVGIGEASYATIAPTIIADMFPTEKRLRMLSIFYIAMPLGSALGYIVGSKVADIAHTVFHEQSSWRWALRVTPLLGVVSVLLVLFFLKEPPRGHVDGQRSSKGVSGKKGFMAYVQDVLYCLRVKTFVFTTLGFTAVTFTVGALAQWAPTFVLRVSKVVNPDHPYSVSSSAIIFGGITVAAGITGTVAGSELSKYLGKYTRKAEALVCSLGMMLSAPLLMVAITVVHYEQLYVSWVFVFLSEFFLCLNWAPVSAILLYSIVPTRRSTAEAVQILISHLFGDAISPLIVGAISDGVFSHLGPYHSCPLSQLKAKAISSEYALFITLFVCALGGGAFLISTLTVEADRKAVEHYTLGRNAKIQDDDGSLSSSDEFDEHKELIGDAMSQPAVT